MTASTRAPAIYFGVDPGTATTGYGVIRTENNTVRWIDSGTISPRAAALDEKLEQIYDALIVKLQGVGPGFICVEQAFYAKNVRTTLILGHARGVILLAGRKCGWEVMEYSPREIKKAVVGNGNATKDQVGFMIRTLLSPPADKRQTDACDALAAAMCGFYHCRSAATLAKGAYPTASKGRRDHV
jgi:crossover junction endodeoxyribonuclease RuvC